VINKVKVKKTRACVICLVLLLWIGARATGAAFSIVHVFDPNGGEGTVNRYGQLLFSDAQFYGLTFGGSSGDSGSLFTVSPDGNGFSTLVSFFGFINVPTGTVLKTNEMFFGETAVGQGHQGSVFSVNTDGSSLTYIHNFTVAEGATPSGALVISSNLIFGMTTSHGSNGQGALFCLSTDGNFYTNLYNFAAATSSSAGDPGALLLSGSTLYGTRKYGGGSNDGFVFAINTNGLGFTNLHGFNGADGAVPDAGLVLAGTTLYGVTQGGGSSGFGTLYRLQTDGSAFTNLHNFDTSPTGALVLSGSTLYGATGQGGDFGKGAVFAVGTDGSGFTNIYSFDGTNGATPTEALLYSGGTLYGTTVSGGGFNDGVLYALTIAPTLVISSAGSAVVLQWQDASFSLQAAPTPTGVFTNVPGVMSPYTNQVSGLQQFFRLSR
jgi:uncharacterized repeat protein (TIGR03803 family)